MAHFDVWVRHATVKFTMAKLGSIGALREWITEDVVLVTWLVPHSRTILQVHVQRLIEVTLEAKDLLAQVTREGLFLTSDIVAHEARAEVLIIDRVSRHV